MDLPCLEWIQHIEQKWSGMGPARKKSFSVLTDLDEIFHFAQSQVQQEDLEVLSRFSERYPVKKSSECAARFRDQGNLSFKRKDYHSAALYYSKGVCNAEKNTEQLSLCYANRSAALFHLGLYDKCLEDIQRAFAEGYPSHLQHKLTNRHTQCMHQLKRLEQAGTAAQQPSQAKERIDGNICQSTGVSVYFTADKGRHLLSTEKKSAGAVVLEDKAFSFVLIPSEGYHTKASKTSIFGTEHRYCHHCLCQTLSCVPCLGCAYAWFCGPRCEREAWRQYHCWECPTGSDLLALGVLAHLALRVTLKAGLKEVQKARETCVSLVNDKPLADSVQRDASNCHNGTRLLKDSLLELSAGEPSGCSKHSDHSACYHGKTYLGIYSLLPHVDKHPPSLRFLLAFSMASLCQRLKEAEPLPQTWSCSEQEQSSGCWRLEHSMLGATALRHMMQLRCNAQAVTAIRLKENSSLAVQSSEEIRVATAIFPILSLLNHSCSPNTSISFSLGLSSPVTVSVRACKDISAGQELFHCYGPHSSRMSVRERRRLLQDQYFFSCNCEVCELELINATGRPASTSNGLKCEKCGGPLQIHVDVHVCLQPSCAHQISTEEVQKTIQMLQNHLAQSIELMENGRTDVALKVLKEAASQADSILMKTHPVQGELADARARAYATMGDWKRAASHLKNGVAAVTCQYGEDSVELGRQLFKVAQLYFNGGDGQSALSVIPTARRLFSLHCDPHCEELQELQDMESCLHGLEINRK